MSKIRINDLARELEVKSKTILDVLPEIGVTEKKTHSSSLEEHEAEKVRAHLRGGSEASVTSKPARPSRDGDEIKTKIDLSHISKPGDVLKAIISKQQPAPTAPARPAPPPAPVETKPAAPVSPAAKAPAPPASAAAPSKLVVPATGPRPTFTVPAPPSAPQVPAASTSAPPRTAAPPAPPATSACSPNDCSADRTTSGLQGSDSSSSFIRRCRKTCARTSSTRATDLPTPSARRSISATVITARRAAADASHAAITCGCASTWSRARPTAARSRTSGQPPRSAFAPAGTALHSARGKRRPDEGLRTAAAAYS